MTARWRKDIFVGHFVRSDTSHVMQAIDVTRHSRITQQLVPSTTALSFVCCSQFACKKKKLFMTFGTTLVSSNFDLTFIHHNIFFYVLLLYGVLNHSRYHFRSQIFYECLVFVFFPQKRENVLLLYKKLTVLFFYMSLSFGSG